MHFAGVVAATHTLVNVDSAVFLDSVSLDASANGLQVVLFTFFDNILISYLVLLHQDTPSIFADADSTNFATLLNLFGYEDTFTKDIVSY